MNNIKTMERNKFNKVYITENGENILHLLYQNTNKDLLIRKQYDLNKCNEVKAIEEFIYIIVKFETNEVENFPKITISKGTEDSHNVGLN